jgi:tetratricopeptide (TPR) repeat protein
MNRRITVLASALLVLIGVGAAATWALTDWQAAPADTDDTQALPIPPFPPRITDNRDYETCLAALADDPDAAVSMAEALQGAGVNDAATHCRGLALIALGRPDDGAVLLETLAATSTAPPLARASVLGQAAQARLMQPQPDKALDDLNQAIVLAPQDAGLLIMRAQTQDGLHHYKEAAADLNAALTLDPDRTDALVERASVRRNLNQLDLAEADVSRALSINPDDADALLERGILRQRTGDTKGARSDWQHALGVDPNSTTADLAQQNLSLLEAGPQTP